MRNRISSTAKGNPELIYSYVEENWKKCTICHKKLFKIIESKGSVIELKCKCGNIENIEI